MQRGRTVVTQKIFGDSAVQLVRYDSGENSMCRNIKTLFNFEPPATDDEVGEASVQFVRKLSGFSKPSRANEGAFQRALRGMIGDALKLLGMLVEHRGYVTRWCDTSRSGVLYASNDS